MFTYTASAAPGAGRHAKSISASKLREKQSVSERVPSEVLILIALLDGKNDWKALSNKIKKLEPNDREDDGAQPQDQLRNEMNCARRRRFGDQGMDGIGRQS
ncbi:hypothetical protein Baya_1250 [Bagarius yarrelli]|uniref:Uncharacterized protein n=1 Tax=Bagarius yarrelli TaxID=175774 RepID=A0A556TKL0_BAGYA|nr:hypothetical protein Baya_1250 [Bagarius yarrelli]